ncbi:MAG: hypothetical protein M1831_007602 [Alyxoria varia]|nr:MAG: hypothetical protein M1831_007602 [Alyxoria varia]
MAPARSTEKERDRVAEPILDFANSLSDRLGREPKDALLDSQLQSHIITLRTSGSAISSSRAAEFDRAGIKLWNKVIRTKRDNDQYDDKQLCLARIFAFYLVDSAYACNRKKPETCIRLLKLANKAAWKQDKLELANSLSGKLESSNLEIDAGTSEQVADLFFEIGRSLHRNNDSYTASKWLEKSHVTLSSHDLDQLSPNASDLNLSVLHYLVRSLIACKTDGAREKAESYLDVMDNTYANKMVISLCRLELLSAGREFNSESYYNGGRNSADQALEDLSVQRLYAEKERSTEWIEKVVIMRLWILTDSDKDHDSMLKLSQELVESVYGVIIKPLSTAGAHAAQTLLWKRIEESTAQRNFQVTIGWCKILLHDLFGASGDLNRTKILRKIMLSSIASHDTRSAREAFNQLSEVGRETPMSRYLMYKVSLKDQDSELAYECLEGLCQQSSKDATMLYACVLEAQSSGDRVQAVHALQRVVKKFEYSAPRGVHLPSLLRCTARLLEAEISSDPGGSTNAPKELAALFEGASLHLRPAQARIDNGEQFTALEADWFARNSYNLALKHFESWDWETITTLLGACQVFIEHLVTHDDNLNVLPDLRQRSMAIHCLLTQAILRTARREDNEQKKLQEYLRITSCTTAIRKLRSDQSLVQPIDSDRKDMLQLWKKQLCAEFEADVHLKIWDGLIKVIDDCKVFQDKKIYHSLADMLLASEAPPTILMSTLEHLINTTKTLSLTPLPTLARWLRILYQISLSSPSRTSTPSTTTETIITRALNLMDTASNTPTTNNPQRSTSSTHPENDGSSIYPPEEIEWLATTTFNRAVDAYCAADEENCRNLGELALECAGRMPEAQGGGRLRALLVDRLRMLRWE